MENVIKEVYAVFGDELPETRSAYSAKSHKPFPILTITKAFKDYKKFKLAYAEYAIKQRTAKAAAKVVTKKATPKKVKHENV